MKINVFIKKFLFATLLTSTFGLIGGCATPTYEAAKESKLIETNYQAAENLLRNLKNPLNVQRAIIVKPLTNTTNADKKTMLGNVIAEQLSARFARAGYKMIDMVNGQLPPATHSENVQLDAVETQAEAQAVLTGNYAISQNYVYITVKLVRPTDNVLLATYNYVLPLDSNIETLTQKTVTTED